MIPFNRWSIDVTERLSLRYISWSVSQYVWGELEYSCVYFIATLAVLKKHWSWLFFLKNIIPWIHNSFVLVIHDEDTNFRYKASVSNIFLTYIMFGYFLMLGIWVPEQFPSIHIC